MNNVIVSPFVVVCDVCDSVTMYESNQAEDRITLGYIHDLCVCPECANEELATVMVVNGREIPL